MFDVFGTIVDWRSSLIHQFNELEKEQGIELPARALGMKTAFIPRRTEYGPQQSKDLDAEEAWDFVAEGHVALSERLIE